MKTAMAHLYTTGQDDGRYPVLQADTIMGSVGTALETCIPSSLSDLLAKRARAFNLPPVDVAEECEISNQKLWHASDADSFCS